MNKGIVAIAMLTLVLGCAGPQVPESRLGQFTAASSFNVRNLDYDLTTSVRVEGEDCHKVGQEPNDSRLQRAMDQAIRNGQAKGVSGDLLVNVRIDQVKKNKPGFIGIPQAYDCLVVAGDLVSLR
jgi:hypothetical protein